MRRYANSNYSWYRMRTGAWLGWWVYALILTFNGRLTAFQTRSVLRVHRTTLDAVEQMRRALQLQTELSYRQESDDALEDDAESHPCSATGYDEVGKLRSPVFAPQPGATAPPAVNATGDSSTGAQASDPSADTNRATETATLRPAPLTSVTRPNLPTESVPLRTTEDGKTPSPYTPYVL
jgi:hypothetical protein